MPFHILVDQMGEVEEGDFEGANLGEAMASALEELGFADIDEAALIIRVSGDVASSPQGGVRMPNAARKKKGAV